ncbi:UNVERIFIED_CONTAM: Unconventional myosin-XVIIIa [Gekko kuhli]
MALKKNAKLPDAPSAGKEEPRSPVPPEGPGRAKSPEPLLNGEAQDSCALGQAMNGLEGSRGGSSLAPPEPPADDAQGLSRKRVVRVVRKVVRKVLPGEESKEPSREIKSPEPAKKEEKPPSRVLSPPPRVLSPAPRVLSPPPRQPPASKPEPKQAAPKDEISVGLKSLMSRGRTKDHRPRSRLSDKKEEEKPRETEKTPPLAEKAVVAPKAAQEAKSSPVVLAKPAAQKASAEEKGKLEPTNHAAALSQVLYPSAPDRPPPPFCLWADVCARASCWSAKTEEQIAAEEAWYETDKVWLVHKDGFSLASQLKTDAAGLLPDGKVKVKLDYDGAVLEVDEDDVEKANPPSCDRTEDLASLVYLNESSVLHTLRQRYGGNLIHTYAGPNMVIINPLSSPSMYSEKVMHMFKGCRREDASPHVYAVAQAAYRNMLMSRQDQSIVLLGSSGSGKSTNCQHLVQYLATVAGSSGKVFSVEKWQALYTILDALGNSGTSLNGNATRFSQIISLDFDQAGQVASASVQTMLLEKLRVAKRPANEATFNVFYYLLACPDNALRTELHFNHLAENNIFGIVPLSKPEEKQKAAQQFSKLQAAMKVMGVSGEEQKAVWLVLGAIYHLGAAGATKAGRKQFARHEWAQKAAYLLGCTLEELSSSIFKNQHKGTLQRSTSFRQGPEEGALGDGSGPKTSALECLEGFASALYSELFTLLISLLNRALKSSQRSLCSMMIVDSPGFQNPEMAGQSRGATFEELCHNYAQERLQTLFHESTFVQELERYKETSPLDLPPKLPQLFLGFPPFVMDPFPFQLLLE